MLDQHVDATRHQRLGQGRALLAACRAADRDAGQADIVRQRLDLAPGLHPEALGQRPRTPAALAKNAAQDEARIGGDAGGIELAEPGTGDHHGTDVAHWLASSGMGFDREHVDPRLLFRMFLRLLRRIALLLAQGLEAGLVEDAVTDPLAQVLVEIVEFLHVEVPACAAPAAAAQGDEIGQAR